MSIIIKKIRLYYLVLVLVAIIIPIIHYPRIYGKDAFQVIWMANALRDGALFSDNTWLIHPASYFGYYPFSYRAIGVPMFLAFLISLLNLFSFGIFGLTEAILVFNIILIIIIYKSSRNLGNRLFEEEWSRFVFVAAMLLSPYIIYRTTMDADTRIIITIIMIILLNLNLKVLNNDNKNIKNKDIFKTTIFLFLLLLVGAFVHRLWVATIITVVLMIFTIIILKYKILQKLTVILILPLSIIAFFVGLEIFGLDPLKIWSPFFDNSTIIGASANLSIDYTLQVGLVIIFFPVGVILTLYKLFIILRKSDDKKNVKLNNMNQQFLRKTLYKLSIILRKSDDKKNVKLNNMNQQFLRNSSYLLLFMVPFLFMAPSYYAITLFLPIVIIFSVQGLIYIKKILVNVSERLERLFPLILLALVVGYSLLYVEIILNINLWYLFVLIIIPLLFYLFIFIINKYSNISFDSVKLQKGLGISILFISMVIFTTTTVEGRLRYIDSNPYPWENRYLTDEEIEIIEYFQNEDINGLIFCAAGIYISERIGGIGFLPTFSESTLIGIPLFYGLINPNYVHENTEFSLSELFRFGLFTFTETDPITELLNSIRALDLREGADFEALVSYNVQYIISINDTFQSGGINNWPLIQSLQQSELFEPVFSTLHLLVWKIY